MFAACAGEVDGEGGSVTTVVQKKAHEMQLAEPNLFIKYPECSAVL